jgi:hypothetical protein
LDERLNLRRLKEFKEIDAGNYHALSEKFLNAKKGHYGG